MSKVLILIIALSGPVLLWAAVFLAAKRSLFTMKSMFRFLYILRWIFVILSAGLLLDFSEQSLSRYGWGALIFSFGLLEPVLWLKRQMSPPPESPAPRR